MRPCSLCLYLSRIHQISSACYDFDDRPTQLLTLDLSAKGGTWEFNNGHCLREKTDADCPWSFGQPRGHVLLPRPTAAQSWPSVCDAGPALSSSHASLICAQPHWLGGFELRPRTGDWHTRAARREIWISPRDRGVYFSVWSLRQKLPKKVVVELFFFTMWWY